MRACIIHTACTSTVILQSLYNIIFCRLMNDVYVYVG